MDLRGDYTCMRAHELLKKVGSKPGWHYVTQSIYYRAIGGFLFVFRIDRGDFKLRRFCRDKNSQKSSSRRSKVSDSHK